MQAKLLGAVDTVASVAQAGDDVAVLIQVVVLGAQVDVHIGVSLVQGLDAFRSGDQADELDPLCAVLLDLGDGVNGAAAGSQHGVQHQHITLRDILGQLAEVLHRLQGLLVAVQANKTDLGGGGGYIAGRKDLVELCAYRLNAPGLGKELGCTLETPRDMYLGFYYAPSVVCEAIKTAIYAQCLLELVGKKPIPRPIPTATISICTGNTNVSAFNAASLPTLIFPTNALSTML